MSYHMLKFWNLVPTGLCIVWLIVGACTAPRQEYDLVLRGGTIYDGTGNPGFVGDIAIQGDSIVAIGELEDVRGKVEQDVSGMAVAPGFINMLSWATESLIQDGKSQSDIRQGVTLEVMGEGVSMGPLSEEMKMGWMEAMGDLKYDIKWNTLGEYLTYLEDKGVSTNVASFVGATTLRERAIGFENRPPTETELQQMKAWVREAMEEGAMGVGASLIYAPAFYADTDELIALCEVAATYDGMYIVHMRSEGNRLLEAVDEVLEIARAASIRAEIYHLKAAGKNNWHKIDSVIAKIESAQAEGLEITADMYNYVAGATGLDAVMPPSVQEGGYQAWATRLKDPAIRKEVAAAMNTDADDWENFFYAVGAPDKIILVEFKNDSLKKYTGKTLADVATIRGSTPEETAMDLVIQDGSRVGAVFFLMNEENVRKQIALPWVSFCSDGASLAAEGIFLQSNPHPRSYGNFARLLGKYVREEEIIPLEEAIRKLTSLPAANLKIKRRGSLTPGYFADVVVFDPNTIQDRATFDQPHQYATGMVHVFVNGKQVLAHGEHTGRLPGRFVKGPGWKE